MNLSNETLAILKNFATINPSLVFRKGTEQATISQSRSILATATIAEQIPEEVGIYDLNLFLGTLSFFSTSPDLVFTEEKMTISADGTEFFYAATKKNLITVPPAKKLDVSNPTASFGLPGSVLQRLLGLGALHTLQFLTFEGKEGQVVASVHEPGNKSSNKGTTVLGKTDNTFVASFATENLKLISSDYTVNVFPEKGYVQFVSASGTISYIVAMEV
jgi:hypothetical protein